MMKSTTFRNWTLAVVAALALGACNCDWDPGRTAHVAAASAPAQAQDTLDMAAGGQGSQAGAVRAGGGFAALPDRGDLVGYPRGRVARRTGAYTWHRADVSEEYALRAIVAGELRITAPDGQLLAFEYERHVEHPTGDWTWIGRLRDAPPGRQAILTFGAKAVFGSIDQAAAAPLRLAMRDGASWLVETDPALLAGVEERVLRPESPDFLLPPLYFANPAASKTSGDTDTVSSSGESVESSSSTTSSTTTVVDVLVGYTPGFATYHGGDSQARTRINFLVDVANQGYINSQIDARVRLAHAMPVNYPDATDNGDTLEKMTGYKSGTGKTIPDPTFSALRNARETYGADLVTLIRKFNTPENDGCGIAWLIGAGMTAITPGYEYFGYSVVGDGIDQGDDGKNYFCRDETMVHEFGHNMGSAHDIETAKGDDGVLQTKEYGRYTYSFGYRTGPDVGDFYTIMAYREKRESGTQQQPYRVFSNPDITFCGTYPCGSSNADNARSLRQTMPIIAGFRSSVVSTVGGAVRDVDGDGRSDLLLENVSAGWMAYWVMSGAVPVRYSDVFTSPAGYRPIVTGDFNRDGKVDVVWGRSSDRHLVLWQGDGSSFSQIPIGQYADGWVVTGVGDVDGDGRADLVLENEAQGLFAYWVMAGATPIRYSGVFARPPGYHKVATGDFNGDGKLDVVWARSVDRSLVMWIGNGEGFTQQAVRDYSEGWGVVGAGDIDGDGRDDLLVANQSQGWFGFWTMAGATPTGYSTVFVQPSNYQIVSAGDYNGDGMLDIVWGRSSDRSLVMWQGTGSSFSQLAIGNYSSGWQPLDVN